MGRGPSTAKSSQMKAKLSIKELRTAEDSWGPLTVDSFVNRSGNTAGRGSVRGRPRGRGRSPASSTAPPTAGTSYGESDQSRKTSKGKGSVYPIHLKPSRAHKRQWSSSSSRPGEIRSKRHSGQDSTEEEKSAPSRPSNPRPKPSGGGSAFTRNPTNESATPLCGYRQGEGPVPRQRFPSKHMNT